MIEMTSATKGMEHLYNGHRYELTALGAAYQPPKRFAHGDWTLVAEIPAQPDGHPVRVYECRMPARFFRVEALPAMSFDGASKPGWAIETGTVPGDLVAALALGVAGGTIAQAAAALQ